MKTFPIQERNNRHEQIVILRALEKAERNHDDKNVFDLVSCCHSSYN